jgi:inner membrane protein
LAAAPVLALAVIGVAVLARRLARSTRPFPLLPAYLVALGGVLFGHLFLDWCTNYGTRLLLPFSGRWLSWDAVPIVDSWLLAALLAAVLLPHFFRMISEEVGERRKETGRDAAILALCFLLAWFGLRGVLHARAVATMDAHLYHGFLPQRIGAFASLGNPFLWHGVVQTSEGWQAADVNLLDNFDPSLARTYYWPEPSPALDAARLTRTARTFLDFARVPYSYVEQTDNGYRVVFRDLRFQISILGGRGFVAEIAENGNFQVLRESFSFRAPRWVR